MASTRGATGQPVATHRAERAPGRARRLLGRLAMDLLALGGVLCIALVVAAVLLDVSLVMFRTGSMAPTIPTGAVAVVREVPASTVRVGDVVTVDRPSDLPVTHRVLTVEGTGAERTITMQGDANDSPDPFPYTVTTVRRVLWSVPGGARLIVAVSSPWVLGAVALGASALVTWAFWPRARR